MRPKFTSAISLIVLIALAAAVPAFAQAPVTLLEQLQAQYKMVKMGSDTSGAAVVDAGTILAIQKGGILSVPYSDATILPTKYQDGTIHSPSTLLTKGLGFGMKKFGKEQTTRLIPSGEKVYPSKIEVHLDKDQVVMTIIMCDSCNKVDPPTNYKAQVVFQFAKGTLATAAAPAVEDTIAQVFSISDDSQDQGGQDQGGQGGQNQGGGQGQGGQGQGGQGQGGQDQQQAEPQTIQMGQTITQVTDAMGQPQKIVNLGPKQIYVYKDLKVTFLNGRVADVQ